MKYRIRTFLLFLTFGLAWLDVAVAQVPRITDVDNFHQFDVSNIAIDKTLGGGGEGRVYLAKFIKQEKFRLPKPGTLKKLKLIKKLKIYLEKSVELPTVYKHDPKSPFKRPRTYSIQFIDGRVHLKPAKPSPKKDAKIFYLDHCLVDPTCFKELPKTKFTKNQRAEIKLQDATGKAIRTFEFPNIQAYRAWKTLFTEMEKIANVETNKGGSFIEVLPPTFAIKEAFSCLMGDVKQCVAHLDKEFKNAHIQGRFRDWTSRESIAEIFGIYVGPQGNLNKEAGNPRFRIDESNKQTIDQALKSKHAIGVVLEHCPGGDLKSALRLPPAQLLVLTQRLITTFVDGLGAMHNNNVTHGDIKLANILLCGSEGAFPKIADFGSYRIKNYRAGGITGTPEFFPPEIDQVGKLEFGESGDYWAAGLTLYKLLLGNNNAYPIEALASQTRTEELIRKELPRLCRGPNARVTQTGIESSIDAIPLFVNPQFGCIKDKLTKLLQCNPQKRKGALDKPCPQAGLY